MDSTIRRPQIRGCRTTHELIRLHVEEIDEACGGDVNGIVTLGIATLMSILSSIYLGNPRAVADRWQTISDSVIKGIEDEFIELGRGERS